MTDLDRFIESLTPREREVYELAAAGYLNKQIADKLNTHIRTVEAHRLKIGAKGKEHGLVWGKCMVKRPHITAVKHDKPVSYEVEV